MAIRRRRRPIFTRSESFSTKCSQASARTAPRPKLPKSLAVYQDLLDRMLAVEPRQRFRDAEELLEGIDQTWNKQALQTLKSHT
jgi:hypothetical protein